MRSTLIFLCVLLHVTGCGKFTYEASSESRDRFDVALTCPPPRVEIGLRLLKPIATERLGNIALIRIRSVVHVRAKDDVEILSPSVAQGPVVMWEADHIPSHTEYVGLQEIQLPRTIGCGHYMLKVEHGELPSQFAGGASRLYVRQARRP